MKLWLLLRQAINTHLSAICAINSENTDIATIGHICVINTNATIHSENTISSVNTSICVKNTTIARNLCNNQVAAEEHKAR